MPDPATPDGPGDELVAVGRVVKPHGLRGEVVVDSWSDHPDRFAVGETMVVDGLGVRRIVASRPHQGRVLVTLEATTDRTAAEGLRGRVLRAAPRDTSDDEAFWADELVGLEVRREDGRVVGTVVDIVEMPPAAGYDLLEVARADDDPLYLPSVDELVAVVEDDDGMALVVVDPPAGLLDDDEADVAGGPGT